jgi:hypothetical protein
VTTVAALPPARRPTRVAQPAGRVTLSGILTLTTGGLAGFLTATNLSHTSALAVGMATWIVASVLWQKGSVGK